MRWLEKVEGMVMAVEAVSPRIQKRVVIYNKTIAARWASLSELEDFYETDLSSVAFCWTIEACGFHPRPVVALFSFRITSVFRYVGMVSGFCGRGTSMEK